MFSNVLSYKSNSGICKILSHSQHHVGPSQLASELLVFLLVSEGLKQAPGRQPCVEGLLDGIAALEEHRAFS